jgi:hypothetical protein
MRECASLSLECSLTFNKFQSSSSCKFQCHHDVKHRLTLSLKSAKLLLTLLPHYQCIYWINIFYPQIIAECEKNISEHQNSRGGGRDGLKARGVRVGTREELNSDKDFEELFVCFIQI